MRNAIFLQYQRIMHRRSIIKFSMPATIPTVRWQTLNFSTHSVLALIIGWLPWTKICLYSMIRSKIYFAFYLLKFNNDCRWPVEKHRAIDSLFCVAAGNLHGRSVALQPPIGSGHSKEKYCATRSFTVYKYHKNVYKDTRTRTILCKQVNFCQLFVSS